MILITGINSFIGKNLEEKLNKSKIKFKGIDKNIKRNTKNKINIDIRDKKIGKLFNKNTILIHLAALSTNNQCKDSPDLAFDINVNGTLNLINLANKKKIKKFIFASTEWVYGNYTKKNNQDESLFIDIEKLDSLYAITKAISEKNLNNKNHSFKKIILRFGIIYGNRKNNLSALESLFIKCKKEDSISVGSLKTSRRFIHVEDVVSGIIKSIYSNKDGIFNLAGENDITLKRIIESSTKILNTKVKINEIDSKNPSIRKPSNKKIKRVMNWRPAVSLVEGLNSLKTFLKY